MTHKHLEIIREQNPFTSLSDIVYDLILQEIICFNLLPGTKLSENVIAQTLGISRSPVKMALEKLTEKGYVSISNRRYYVKEFSKLEYKNLSDLGQLLEPYAMGEAALKLKPAQIDYLYEMAYELQHLYRQIINKEITAFFNVVMDVEYKFHSYIVHAAGNKIVEKIYEENKLLLFRYRSYLLCDPPPGCFELLENDHIVLCDALKLGDKRVAQATASRHLSISKLLVEQEKLLKAIGEDNQ